MKLSKVHQFMLFSLGYWSEQAEAKIKNPLHVRIKKVDFVNLMQKGKFAEKGERALYKNLEFLEKKKLVSYANKELMLTERGRKEYNTIKQSILPYLHTAQMIHDDPLSFPSRVQTKF